METAGPDWEVFPLTSDDATPWCPRYIPGCIRGPRCILGPPDERYTCAKWPRLLHWGQITPAAAQFRIPGRWRAPQ